MYIPPVEYNLCHPLHPSPPPFPTSRSNHPVFIAGKVRLSSEQLSEIEDIKNAVARLYSALQVDEHHVMQERELQEKLEQLHQEIEPFEQVSLEQLQ